MTMNVVCLLFGIVVLASGDQVCYQPFGCFSSDGTLVKTPQSPDQINTHFKLYDRQHRHTPYKDLGGTNWLGHITDFASAFNANRPTKIIIHGFNDNGDTAWVSNIRDALLNKDDFNVLVVDWGGGSSWPYEQATGNSFLVGEELAILVSFLNSDANLDYNDVHIIGHSLGAQIAGQTGHALQGKISRISALDPADPGFSGKPINRRLDSTDAVFVDAIHTDGSHFNFVSGYGTKDSVGDVDFYPNGGEHQPGCAEKPGGSALNGILHGALGSAVNALTCSHSRAHEYFLESLTSSCKYYAHQCSSIADFDAGKCLGCPSSQCPVMGYDADQYQARGSYYLATSTSARFCGKEYYIEIHISHAIHSTYGELLVTLVGSRGTSEELKFTKLMRYYHQDDIERHVVATHTDIGDVQEVKVKYIRGHDLHALGAAHEIRIGSVIVEPAENPNQRVKICGHDAHIHEKSTITLHSHSGC